LRNNNPEVFLKGGKQSSSKMMQEEIS